MDDVLESWEEIEESEVSYFLHLYLRRYSLKLI